LIDPVPDRPGVVVADELRLRGAAEGIDDIAEPLDDGFPIDPIELAPVRQGLRPADDGPEEAVGEPIGQAGLGQGLLDVGPGDPWKRCADSARAAAGSPARATTGRAAAATTGPRRSGASTAAGRASARRATSCCRRAAPPGTTEPHQPASLSRRRPG